MPTRSNTNGLGGKVACLALAGLVVLATATTASLATSHLGGDTLYACAKLDNGQLRLVGEGEECLPSETAVSWSAAGGGTTFATTTQTVAAVPGLTSATATCPVGGRVVGGGGHAAPVQWGNVIATYPASESTWTVTAAINTTGSDGRGLTAYAICAVG